MESSPFHHLRIKNKSSIMKNWKFTVAALLAVSSIVLLSFTDIKESKSKHRSTYRSIPKGCVFRTVMGEEPSDSNFIYKTGEKIIGSIDHGLDWIIKAQNETGGWGAGSHHRQDVM